jgi:hypothetical protein
MKVKNLKELRTNMSDWIVVDKQLPEEWTSVLVWGSIGNDAAKVHIADYHLDFEGDDEKPLPVWSRDDSDGWLLKVTHWQPLPSGPNAENPQVQQVKSALGIGR